MYEVEVLYIMLFHTTRYLYLNGNFTKVVVLHLTSPGASKYANFIDFKPKYTACKMKHTIAICKSG